MRGRPPKPAALRLIEGNPGHRPIPLPPEPPPGAVRCPAWLDPAAKVEWRRVAPGLTRMRMLSPLDVAMLIGYCQAFSELQYATEELQRRGRTFTTPSGYKQQRPEVGMAHVAMGQLRLFAGELGMSPSSRMRLGTIDRGDDFENDAGILS